MSTKWFEVDQAGLAEIAKRRGMSFIVTEPVQNAWDEDSSEVHFTLQAIPGRPQAVLTVTDDSPEGFRDLSDSYMMFRTSRKIEDPEKRGRFNVGEKLLLAVAKEAEVVTTTGSVRFDDRGRHRGRKKTEAGSTLTATLKMTRAEVDEALEVARSLIPPSGIATYVNGERLPDREPIASRRWRLETETQAETGGFKSVYREALVELYPTIDGESAKLYEMGIPVDEVECDWHVNVGQKVPLSVDRNSVRIGYSQKLSGRAVEMMADRLTEEQARSPEASRAIQNMDSDDAVRSLVRARFGEKVVVYDPSCPESNKRAIDSGYRVIHGGELDKRAWDRIRKTRCVEPAGRVFEVGVPESPDGAPMTPRSEWTPLMEKIAAYAEEFSAHAVGTALGVQFVDMKQWCLARGVPLTGGNSLIAACGKGVMVINTSSSEVQKMMEDLEEGWDDKRHHALDALLIHECAHVKVDDHLTDAFHEECCRIGAAMMRGFYGSV